MNGYLKSGKKSECLGCGACADACKANALKMKDDAEGFSYPEVNQSLCVGCSACNKACPVENMPKKSKEKQFAFGGHINDKKILEDSTSGGFFSAIADAWCDENYAVFGAVADRLNVYHSYITDKKDLYKFRKSKYSQSKTDGCYQQAKELLQSDVKVLFSGTPCQIAGLKSFLGKDYDNLLTVEVICEGVPTPLFACAYDKWLNDKYKSNIQTIDYRYKDGNKWDFQVMQTELDNGKIIKKDRWINPFWSIWLEHLMSRPSCYECQFATSDRVADISLGDLWGVHLYCPELYAKNKGASLAVCNTEHGRQIFEKAKAQLYGHELDFSQALKYQSPMRKHIAMNPKREEFMQDVRNKDYEALCKKWSRKPGVKLLWSKYIYGNRQKVFLWNLRNGKKN